MNGDPGRTRTWEVYVDNLFEGEIFLREELEEREGTSSSTMDIAEELYDEWNCVGNSAETLSRQSQATIMGYRNDGPEAGETCPTATCSP